LWRGFDKKFPFDYLIKKKKKEKKKKRIFIKCYFVYFDMKIKISVFFYIVSLIISTLKCNILNCNLILLVE